MKNTRNITEAQAERIIDSRVMRRLNTDRAYLNAENAEDQANREQTITDEEYAAVAREYAVAS